MSENKFFTVKKSVPGDVLFVLSPLSNPTISRVIHLTNRMPQQNLPLDWALGIFLDPGLFGLYAKKVITFTDNEGMIQAARDAGVYFGEIDFTPTTGNEPAEILGILQKGVRLDILNAIKKYGDELVRDVAIKNTDKLTQSVISMLENLWKIQLTMDGASYSA